ncbi:MAG TPA: tetratricopeptide repeat protein [Chitinophagaceae bacterium]|nr:tetratricopeptide repeat protein [Chitinophagaceae bacterium]
MKKKNIYLLSIALFIIAVAGIVIKYNIQQKEKQNQVYGLVDRTGALAEGTEWQNVKTRANMLLAAIQKDPSDTASKIKLAALFIQEARITGNYMYYDMAAMKYVNDILAVHPNSFNALVFKALIYLSQHHFADGLVFAHQAQQINPYNAYVYGLLVDGNVEMGYYDSAVSYADKMVSVRPDLTSYSRVSYLREIFGDYKGAIAAMKMAVEAGGQGDEYTEWTRYQLANLYEKTGDFKTADTLYNVSLSMRPDYGYAMAGLARVAMANNDYGKAITYFEKADSLVMDNSIKEELVDAYRAAGQTRKAEELAKEVIDDLQKSAQAGIKDANIGHYADRELAFAYLKVNDNDKALEHAMLEYNRRPDNIDVNETVAWVYYNRGEYDKALPYIKVALKTHSKNPVLLSRAALIFYKAGDKIQAKSLMAETTPTNPYIDRLLMNETSAMIHNL